MLLTNKKGIISGITNNRSIGWGIAQILHKHGARLAFTYQNSSIAKRIEPLAEEVGAELLLECDVTNEETTKKVFAEVARKWDNELDFFVHSLAFAPKDGLKGSYLDTPRESFRVAMDVSCYSFTAMAQHCKGMMSRGGSLLTLSYYGAEKVMPSYNLMGVCKAALEASVRYLAVDLGVFNIRVNAVSAGPVKTVAATGIDNFSYLLKRSAATSPLGRNVTLDDIGKSALFLLSDLSTGVTGEVLHVDAGYHVVGMDNNKVDGNA